MILLTALMSPRDEDELISHLRRLGAAEHLQTHTIPLLSTARAAEPSPKGGLLGKFRKRSKETAEPMGGCDPEVFAGEIRTFLARRGAQGGSARQRPSRGGACRRRRRRRGGRRSGANLAALRPGLRLPRATAVGIGPPCRARRRLERLDVVVAVRVEIELLREGCSRAFQPGQQRRRGRTARELAAQAEAERLDGGARRRGGA